MSPFELALSIFGTCVLGRDQKGEILDVMLLEYAESLKGGAPAVLSDATLRRRHKCSDGRMEMSISIGRFLRIMPVMTRQQASFRGST